MTYNLNIEVVQVIICDSTKLLEFLQKKEGDKMLRAYVIRQDPNYTWGLSGLGHLSAYFACSLHGDLQKIVDKRNGQNEIVVAVTYTDSYHQDIMRIANYGYRVSMINSDDLMNWAQQFDPDFGAEVCRTVVPQCHHNMKTVDGEKAFVRYILQMIHATS